MWQKYIKFWLLALVLAIFSGSCGYPYNTPQARAWRKQQKQLKAEQRQVERQQRADSTARLAAIAQDSGAVAATKQRGGRPAAQDSFPPSPDSLAQVKPDSVAISNSKRRGGQGVSNEELRLAQEALADSLRLQDSLNPQPRRQWREFALSPDSVSVPVMYEAKDSMIYALSERKIYLYGEAELAYEQYRIKAGYIVVNFLTQTATAEGIQDSSGKTVQLPNFTDGEQTFDAQRIEYNFRTKKGKVYQATTKQGDGFFLSESTKFVSGGGEQADVIYSENCLYTTCNHKHPHFGIRSRRAKVVPNKVIVVGPSYLEIMGVPTPVVLPFGFFPITKSRKNGLILSTDIEMSEALGPGLRGMGYYWRISEAVDLALRGDIYMRGTFRVNAESHYNQRYKANGTVGLQYANIALDTTGGIGKIRNQTFNINWKHQQDPKAHPFQTFSANVNFGSSDHFRNNFNSAAQVLQSTFNSNIAYTRRFPGTPFTLSMRASHSQNTSTGDMNVTLPGIDLSMNQIFPFKRKNPVGKQRWYERVAFRYNMNATNNFSIKDSVLFDRTGAGLQKVLDTMQYNIRHNPNLNFSLKILKHFNLQPNIRYSETWHFQANEQTFDPNIQVRRDTLLGSDGAILNIRTDTLFGQINRSRSQGFHSVRDFGAGATLNTQIFALGTFNLGALRRMWARFEPNIGYNWRPDFGKEFWGYYGQVQADTRYPDRFNTFARFAGVPSQGATSALTYGLNMRWEAEVRKPKRDTSSERFRKIIILNNFQIAGDRNFVARDSLQWSVVRMNASTVLFKLINVMVSSNFDPYEANPLTNARIPVLAWDQSRRLARFTSANINASAAFSSTQLYELFVFKKEASQTLSNTPSANQAPARKEFFQGFALNYNLNIERRYIDQVDSLRLSTHELSLTGLVNLTQTWNFRIGRVGYDFANKRVTFPDFTFARDLHCWQMGLNWQPERRTFAFFIQVKPSSLGFINVPVRRNFFDPF